MRRADNPRMYLMRKIEVGDESSGSGHQRGIFQPCNRRADIAAPLAGGTPSLNVHTTGSSPAHNFQFNLGATGIYTERHFERPMPSGNQKNCHPSSLRSNFFTCTKIG
jgi:hypothetical protein